MGGDTELSIDTGEATSTIGFAGPLVDIHTHILPGVDDGPRTMADAIHMLRLAEADGIEYLIATPHAHHCNPSQIIESVAALNAAVDERGIGITVLPGSEVRIAPDLIERYKAGNLVTLNNSRYLLLELYLHHEWQQETVLRVTDRLRSAGLVPVLAHPERYPYLRKDFSFINRLIHSGVLLQINAPSLTGYYGPDAQQFAQRLIERRLAHAVASDAHNPVWRPPVLRQALGYAQEFSGVEYVQSLVRLAASIGGVKQI